MRAPPRLVMPSPRDRPLSGTTRNMWDTDSGKAIYLAATFLCHWFYSYNSAYNASNALFVSAPTTRGVQARQTALQVGPRRSQTLRSKAGNGGAEDRATRRAGMSGWRAWGLHD